MLIGDMNARVRKIEIVGVVGKWSIDEVNKYDQYQVDICVASFF